LWVCWDFWSRYLREDSERCERQDVPQLGAGWTGDWIDILGARKRRVNSARRVARRMRAIGADQLYAAWWHAVSRGLVRSCASRFLDADTVVTSRLHGHILASLLGVQKMLLDNSYGKNGAYYRTWHQELPSRGCRVTTHAGRYDRGAWEISAV
jgi:pyruvyl transferase EpsO